MACDCETEKKKSMQTTAMATSGSSMPSRDMLAAGRTRLAALRSVSLPGEVRSVTYQASALPPGQVVRSRVYKTP